MPRALTARLMEKFRGAESRRLPLGSGEGSVSLTRREWQVLELLREGDSTSEIAGRLGISAVTVRRYVSDLSAKLGVSTRADLVAAARI